VIAKNVEQNIIFMFILLNRDFSQKSQLTGINTTDI